MNDSCKRPRGVPITPLVIAFLLILLGFVGSPPSAGAATTVRKCYCHNICNGTGGDQCTSSTGQQQGHQKSVNCHNCLVAVEAACNDDAANYDSCFSGANPPCENGVEDTFGKCNGCGNGIVDPGEKCDDGNNQDGDGCNENCQRECVGGCDDANPCTTDSCDGTTGLCQYAPNAGASCDDGNACTSGDLCQADATCSGTAVICTALDQCHGVGTCDPQTGLCSDPVKPDGSSCTDDSTCTNQDQCVNGICVPGVPISCDDANVCTDDSVCDSVSGCVHSNLDNGTPCSDQNACNGAETCQEGACSAGTPPNCDDGNPCTDDSCDANVAEEPCLHDPIDTGETTCGVGACERTIDNCIDGQPQSCIPGEPSEEICNQIDDDCDGVVDGPDLDSDGSTDICELCDDDPNKTELGICGCGVSDLDSDEDGTADCNDQCPSDSNKVAPGICGCGVSDVDSDEDGTADCNDQCPSDSNKVAPGICGCGVSDVDSDEDGTADCNDQCPIDFNKVAPGICGCGVSDLDSDEDGTADCNDQCPSDFNKVAPGICGCGVSDLDSDEDGTADCNDQCSSDPGSSDPAKIVPGVCGCGVPDTDSDGDGMADCVDQCAGDPNKTAPGICGCGVPDTDTDGDGTADCNEECPADSGKIVAGACGCNVPDLDSDGDGVADCLDECSTDPGKIVSGICGCGVPDTDMDEDGVPDCIDNCPIDFNPDQLDTNGDGVGDLCEIVEAGPAGAPAPAPPGTGVAGGRNCTLVPGVTKAGSSDLVSLGLLAAGIGLLAMIRRRRRPFLGLVRLSLVGLSVTFLLLPVGSVHALNVQLLRPSTGQVQGYQLFTSETLPRYHLAIGLNANLASHPLEQVPPGATSRAAGVVDRFVTTDFLVSYGILDRWTINLDMPVNIFHDIAPTTLVPTRDRGGGDAGDLYLNSKIQIFDANKTGSHLGMAIVPFVTIPTGRESIFFGDSSVTGGAVLVGDAQWKSNRFYVNVGSRFRRTETYANLTVKNEWLYGAGFERPLVKKWDLDVIAEVFGSTTLTGNFIKQDISSPLEGMLILRKKWLPNRQLVTQIGGGAGISNGYGATNYRVVAGVSYAWDLKKKTPSVEIIRTNKIHFEFGKARILPSSFPILDRIVAEIKSRPEIEGVRIEGHTDNRGMDAYNDALSDKRSAAVLKYLVHHGVSRGILTSAGKGEREPIAKNEINGRDHPAGRAENRRVEFYLSIRPGANLKVVNEGVAPTYIEGLNRYEGGI